MIQPLFCHTRWRPIAAAALLVATAATLTGCGAIAYMGNVVGGGEKTYQVDARYRGLAGHSAAVMVGADRSLLYRNPNAPERLGRMVSAAIVEHVDNVTLMDPRQVAEYQQQHPYWIASPHSELIQALGVERLIVIDLRAYRTHEPGNAHVWKGVISAGVGVYEADADDPDNPSFRTDLRVQFPEDSTIGVVNSDEQSIELGMLHRFARKTARLFHDHEIRK